MAPRWTPQQVQAAAAAGDALLVDLRADWCVQCGPQERVLERLEPEFADRVAIVSVDVGEHPATIEEHGISGLPAFLLYAGGELRSTIRGFRRAPELRQALRDLLAQA